MNPRHLQITPGPAEAIGAGFRALVPELVTNQLTLRAVTLADFEGWAEIVCTERGRYVDGPMSHEDAWYEFATLSSLWMLHGHGGWAVEETATRTLLGFVVLGLEPGDIDVELGFLFREIGEGRGFAAEAATAVRDWAYDTLKLPALDSYIDARNARSLALATRLGGTDETPEDWAASGTRRFRHVPSRRPA